MPAVPTSQIRVVPQAPRVEIGAFIPKVDPTAGLGVFSEAAKLPLMFEQINLEKERNKLERNKLKLAEMEANYMAQNYERIQQGKLQEAELQRQDLLSRIEASRAAARKSDADAARARMEAEGYRVLTPEERNALGRTGQTPSVPAAGGGGVLAAETITETPTRIDVPTFTVTTGQPETPKPVVPKTRQELIYRPTVSTLAALPDVPVINGTPDFTNVIEQEVKRQSDLLPPPPARLTVNEADKWQTKRNEDIAAIRQKLQPQTSEERGLDDNNLPFVVPVVKVGNVVVDRGDPILDKDTLLKDKAIETGDVEFKKRMAQTTEAQRAQQKQNANNLVQAAELLANWETNGGFIDWTKIGTFIGFPKLSELASQDLELAANKVRQVVQQSSREILGGQFTERESRDLTNRAFNPLFDAEANFDLIANNLRVLQTAIRDQEEASRYFDANGTLAGFQPQSELIAIDGSPQLQRITELAEQATARSRKGAGKGSTKASPKPDRIKGAVDIYLGLSRATANAVAGPRP
jgi:hypothetical protein